MVKFLIHTLSKVAPSATLFLFPHDSTAAAKRPFRHSCLSAKSAEKSFLFNKIIKKY